MADEIHGGVPGVPGATGTAHKLRYGYWRCSVCGSSLKVQEKHAALKGLEGEIRELTEEIQRSDRPLEQKMAIILLLESAVRSDRAATAVNAVARACEYIVQRPEGKRTATGVDEMTDEEIEQQIKELEGQLGKE